MLFRWEVGRVMQEGQRTVVSQCGQHIREARAASETQPALCVAGIVYSAEAGRQPPAALREQLRCARKMTRDHGGSVALQFRGHGTIKRGWSRDDEGVEAQ